MHSISDLPSLSSLKEAVWFSSSFTCDHSDFHDKDMDKTADHSPCLGPSFPTSFRCVT